MRADIGRRKSPRVIATNLGVALFCLPVAWLTTANSAGVGEWVIVLPQGNYAPPSRVEKIEMWSVAVAETANRSLLQSIGLWNWITITELAALDRPDLTAARLSVLRPA